MSNELPIRAFLAIEPPREVLTAIGTIQNRLRSSCPFDIRWVKPEGIHVTLKFFGAISGEDIPAISQVVERQTGDMAPLKVSVGTLGVFPSLKRPRVLWIGMGGDIPPLILLQQRLEQDLAGLGFAGEERPFRPHLTIGRVKTPKTSADPEAFLRQGSSVAAGSFCADGLGLYKSDLTPQGARYTRLAWFPFGVQGTSETDGVSEKRMIVCQ